MQIRKYIKWSINYNKWKVHPTKSEISTCMKSPRASITNNQIPSISTYCTHIIAAASSQLLSIGQWQGYIVKCQPTSSIDISIAGKNNRNMSKLIILYWQRKIQWLLKATYGWRLADHPAWASNCEGLICSPKKITHRWDLHGRRSKNLCGIHASGQKIYLSVTTTTDNSISLFVAPKYSLQRNRKYFK